MRLIRLLAVVALFIAPAAFAATTSGSLTAAGQNSATFQVYAGEQLKVTLTGTWSATVAVQALRGSPAYNSVALYDSNVSSSTVNVIVPGEYRITALTYASGTVNYSAVTSTTSGGGGGPADSAGVIAYWSGTCSSSTYLRGDGSCQTPSAGGDPWTSQTCTTNCTISTNFRRVDCDATAGNVTVTLGALATYTDVEVGKIDTSANTCTVDPNASETIGSDAHLTDVIVAPDTVLTYRKFSSTNWLLR